MTVFTQLKQVAQENPTHPAVVIGQQEVTYQELLTLAVKLGNGLREVGVTPGDRVVFFLPDSLEEVLCYLACFYIGAIAVPLYENIRGDDLAFMIKDIEPSVIITNSTLVKYIRPDKHIKIYDDYNQLLSDDNSIQAYTDTDKTAMICYTSGSTSKPKGVMHSQQHIINNTQSFATRFGFDTPPVSLCAYLDFNASFCSILLTTLLLGGTAVISQAKDAEEKLKEIIEYKINFMFSVPSGYAALIKIAKEHPPFKHSLSHCSIGGDKSSQQLFDDFYQTFQVHLTAGMGMTETFCQSSEKPGEPAHVGSAGFPLPGVTFKIVDEHNRTLEPYQKGELLIQSIALTQGYWRNEAATQASIRDGWLHTGDIGYLNEAGYFYFVDRQKNIIIVDGDNVTPSEVEATLRQHDAVNQAVVIGKQTSNETEAVYAYVTLHPDATSSEAELIQFCSEQLADFKVPKHITILDKLPTNARGKINRLALKGVKS